MQPWHTRSHTLHCWLGKSVLHGFLRGKLGKGKQRVMLRAANRNLIFLYQFPAKKHNILNPKSSSQVLIFLQSRRQWRWMFPTAITFCDSFPKTLLRGHGWSFLKLQYHTWWRWTKHCYFHVQEQGCSNGCAKTRSQQTCTSFDPTS